MKCSNVQIVMLIFQANEDNNIVSVGPMALESSEMFIYQNVTNEQGENSGENISDDHVNTVSEEMNSTEEQTSTSEDPRNLSSPFFNYPNR